MNLSNPPKLQNELGGPQSARGWLQLTAHTGNKAAQACINPRTSLPLNKWPLQIDWSIEAPVIPGLLLFPGRTALTPRSGVLTRSM